MKENSQAGPNRLGDPHAGVVVVVVTYNGMQWIDRCLESLRGASQSVHTVVIDNGSTDGTMQHIERQFPEMELIKAEKNLGFGQANNVGLRIALERNIPFAFLLNQDAWVLPDTIARLVQASREHPGFGVLSPLHLNGRGDALDLQFSRYIVPDRCPGLYSDLVLGRANSHPYPVHFVNAAAWLITAQCLRTVGGFNPSFFHYGEDDNYTARLHYHKMQLGIVAETFIHHDRADRSENTYMANSDLRDARRLVIEYADPNQAKDPALELSALRWGMAKHLALGRKQGFGEARRRLRLMRECGLPEVRANRILSRQVGPSFLK